MRNLLDQTNQSILDQVTIGETVMFWYEGQCLLESVVAKGAKLNEETNRYENALIVEIDGKEAYITKIV